jgi:hypothetical protein
MASITTSANRTSAAIVGDACLFTAAAFCVLAVFGPLLALALLVGPAAAWLLHDRRIDRTAVVSGVIGIAAGLVTVSGVLVLLSLVAGAIGPIGGWEFAVPVALLAIVSLAFLALIVALDIDSVRDLMPARRTHTRLDVARLVSTTVIAVFLAVVSFVQATNPESEIGEAGIFALAAAIVGAVTMTTAQAIYTRWEERSGIAGTAGGA